MHFASWVARVGLLILLGLIASRGNGQTLTTLLSFNVTNGAHPNGGLVFSGSTLYGMTPYGGANGYGTIFSIPVGGGNPTVISFNGIDGAQPYGNSLALSGSTFYGMTEFGGTNSDGTIFSIPVGGSNLTTLLSFNGTNGRNPEQNGLTLGGSTLYGATYEGGANSWYGTVFSIPLTGGTPSTLYSFANDTNGHNPTGSVTLSGSSLYGVTYGGGVGSNNYGTIYRINTDGSGFHTILSFNGSDGRCPYGSLTLSGSTLYGTTAGGGAHDSGTVFSIPLSGGTLTTLFSFNGTNGALPQGDLTLVGSTLYGTTTQSNNGYGTVFSINTDGTGFQNVFSFSGTNGASPHGDLQLRGSTFYGMTSDGGENGYGTVFALNIPSIAPPSIALSNPFSATIISGGSAMVGMTVTNSASSSYNLNFTVNALVQSGSAALGTLTYGSGSLAPSASQSCTVSATSTNPGNNTISLTASDPNASNSPQTTAATLTVLDHANASLSSTATQRTQTINFGNVLKGATIPSQSFTIYNQAANTTAAYTANLKLTGFAVNGDPALNTNLAAFNNLAASGGTACTASLNSSNYTTAGITTITMSASQLVDDSSLPGAGSNNNGGITVTLQGNVGNATADANNSPTSFGTALTAPVASSGSYANLESKVTATTGSGGAGMVGSTATILAGTAGVSTTASMAWRTAASNPQTGAKEAFVSDVVDLSGIGIVDGQTKDGSVHTDTFVLQMDYDPLAVMGRTGLSEWAAAQAGLIQMDYLDDGLDDMTGTADDLWQLAVAGNFGSTNRHFVGVGPWNNDTTLGDYGVNIQTHTVWAVLDHTGDFAVTPEPSTLMLLVVGAIVLLGCGLRRRAARRATNPTGFAQPQEDGPAILSFTTHQVNMARRAA